MHPPIWSPSYKSSIQTVEKLQEKMVKYLFFNWMITNDPPDLNYVVCWT